MSLLLAPRRILRHPLSPSEGCKVAGYLGLPLDPMADDIELRALGRNLADFKTQDGAGDPGVLTRPGHDIGF